MNIRNRHKNKSDNVSDGASSATINPNRPKENVLTQQRLPAFKPTFNTKTVLPLLFGIGVVFLPIGVLVLLTSMNIKEQVIDYTDCLSASNSSIKCSDEIMNLNATERDCFCCFQFTLNETWDGEVFMYYGIEHFYQNHRRYVSSRSEDQLLGKIQDYDNGATEDKCDPFFKDDNGTVYFPCGSIANSMFSDVIELRYEGDPVPMIRTGIAWESDKEYKFKNPPNNGTKEDLMRQLQNFAKPQHWKRNLWELDTVTKDGTGKLLNNGLDNEDLIVWMRTAALPNFRKLYRKINHTDKFSDGLPEGKYELNIEYNFEVVSFNGRKNIVFTTQSLLGGKNLFLGIAYIVVGSICILLGAVFFLIHWKWGAKILEGSRKMHDMSR